MRRTLVALVLLVLMLVSSALTAPTPLKIGIGGFGGLSIPIAQKDQKSGTEFGIRARIKAIPLFTLEPNVTFTKWGKPDPVDDIDLGINGSKLTSFGLNAVIGGGPGVPGLKPIFIIGAGSYKIKNDDTQFDETKLGYLGGIGLMMGVMPKIDVDIRGTFLVIPIEGGSKKAVGATAGLTLNL